MDTKKMYTIYNKWLLSIVEDFKKFFTSTAKKLIKIPQIITLIVYFIRWYLLKHMDHK